MKKIALSLIALGLASGAAFAEPNIVDTEGRKFIANYLGKTMDAPAMDTEALAVSDSQVAGTAFEKQLWRSIERMNGDDER